MILLEITMNSLFSGTSLKNNWDELLEMIIIFSNEFLELNETVVYL